MPFKVRLGHYRVCADPRCQARAVAAAEIGGMLAKELARQRKIKI